MNPRLRQAGTVYRNIHVSQIARYRLPLAGFVSILHRISGAALFLVLPVIVWLLDRSLSSEVTFAEFARAFSSGVGFFPGWLVKFLVWVVVGAWLGHFFAGLRHLWMDVTHSVSAPQGKVSAQLTLFVSGGIWLLIGAKLAGLY